MSVFKCDDPRYDAALEQREQQIAQQRKDSFGKYAFSNDGANFCLAFERVFETELNAIRLPKVVNSFFRGVRASTEQMDIETFYLWQKCNRENCPVC